MSAQILEYSNLQILSSSNPQIFKSSNKKKHASIITLSENSGVGYFAGI